jgi:hypothetical protein
VPLADWDRTTFSGPARFQYDAEQDVYRCPEGHPLHPATVRSAKHVVIYRADPATGNACPVKAACTSSDRGRTIQRGAQAAFVEQVQTYQHTEPYQKAIRKRRVWVEPLFGEAKQWHGLAQFRLRGVPKVNSEALLIGAGQNLKRLLSWRGWRRRPFPGGAAGIRVDVALLQSVQPER